MSRARALPTMHHHFFSLCSVTEHVVGPLLWPLGSECSVLGLHFSEHICSCADLQAVVDLDQELGWQAL